jgi:hypothetical protein
MNKGHLRISLLALAGSLFFATSARAGECTHDVVAQSVEVLRSVADAGERFGFPTLPTEVADVGPNAGVPYVETLTLDSLALFDKSVLSASRHTYALQSAIEGRCGEPLSDAETSDAQGLLDRFDPWIAAWQDAVPEERARRATDRAAATAICDMTTDLQVAEANIAHEKASHPSVLDLAYLHDTGRRAQGYVQALGARRKLFLRDRKKPFTLGMCAR